MKTETPVGVKQISIFDDASEPRRFAVLDTETNWDGKVMSIGIVVADDAEGFPYADSMYFVLSPEFEVGGMYSEALGIIKPERTKICRRRDAVAEILQRFAELNVGAIFAYNARFDRGLLPELNFDWYDIMRLAAYKQYNPNIPADAPCLSSGRMVRGYGVENVMRMFAKDYRETHNALVDAADELTIMRLLRHGTDKYIKLK